jgi:hypothetical protein
MERDRQGMEQRNGPRKQDMEQDGQVMEQGKQIRQQEIKEYVQ